MARGFARLRQLHGFLPYQQAAGVIVQKVVAGNRVDEATNEVVDDQRKLGFGTKVWVSLRAYIGGTGSVCGD